MVDSSVWLYSDRDLLTRVLQNFLSNAIKYTREGRVMLGLRRRPGGAEIQVWDTGPGIAEEDQVKVFHEFERLKRQAHHGEDGLGLGLAIVSRYAELLGHPLRLVSEQGRGTLFAITVTYGQERQQGSSMVQASSGRDLEGLSVLCLDNDHLILDGMQQLLLTMGAEVDGVATRAELLQKFSDGSRPDIVLADYHLDDGDTGLSAMVEVRKLSGAQVPCVIISADDSDVIRDRAKAVGFRFLSKPVNAARLRALVLALTRN
jgi:CheY-like chemotaxis protein/anti-sigma regulatory factor (Ser/Thr protein kinase)